jgi:hypothetical protein
MRWCAAIGLLLGALLPDEAVEPVDPPERGALELLSPGPCGGDRAMVLHHEGEGAQSIGLQLPIENMRGKRVELSTRAQTRGGPAAPRMWVEVSFGNPPRVLDRSQAATQRACERLAVEVEVPPEVSLVTVGVEMKGAGVLSVEAIRLRELGPSKPVDWDKVNVRAVVKDWGFNEGLIRAPRADRSLQLQPDGSFRNAVGDALVADGEDAYQVRLRGGEGRLTLSSRVGSLRIEGMWTRNGRTFPLLIEVTEAALRIRWAKDRVFNRVSGPEPRGCHVYLDRDLPFRVCGLQGQAPAAAMVLFLGAFWP